MEGFLSISGPSKKVKHSTELSTAQPEENQGEEEEFDPEAIEEMKRELRLARIIGARHQAKMEKSFQEDRINQMYIDDVRVRSVDLDRLRGEEWLNDVIIDAYACILKSEAPQIAIISSYFVKNKVDSAELNSTYFSKNVNELQDYRLIGVPVNTGNLHWTLLVIDIQKKNLIYFDTLTHSTTDRGQTIVAEIKRFLSNNYPEEFVDEEWTSIYPSTHALQQDSVNCGVFICHFLKLLTTAVETDEEVQMSLFSQAPDSRGFREEIRTRICSHF